MRNRMYGGPSGSKLFGLGATTALLLSGLGVVGAVPAQAESTCSGAAHTWTGADGDEQWGNAGNWSPNSVPGASDPVSIAGSEEYPAYVGSAGGTICSLSVSGAAVSITSAGLTVTGALTLARHRHRR